MISVILIEDVSFQRKRLSNAFALAGQGISVESFEADVDFINYITDFLKTKSSDHVILVIDLKLNRISYGDYWCHKNAHMTAMKKAKFGPVQFDDMRVHGVNIYNYIRSEISSSIKIAILTAYSKKQVGELTGITNFLDDDPNAVFIYRTNSPRNVADIIAFAKEKLSND